MKNKLMNLFFGIVFIIGFVILLYPTISDWINDYHQSHVISTYQADIDNLDDEAYKTARQNAELYNKYISHYPNINSALSAEKDFPASKYNDLLDIGDIGVMGILKIPTVDIELPIYHGTGQDELQVGVGHLQGSSLPIGGKSTHSVLTGHRGLPSSRLLTDIDQLEEGDIFYIQVLRETIAYEVDQIKTVLPEELDDMHIVEGEDYCTLVTCTPYGINTHRLLVRGKRIAYVDLKGEIYNEVSIFPMIIVMLIVIVLYFITTLRGRRDKSEII